MPDWQYREPGVRVYGWYGERQITELSMLRHLMAARPKPKIVMSLPGRRVYQGAVPNYTTQLQLKWESEKGGQPEMHLVRAADNDPPS